MRRDSIGANAGLIWRLLNSNGEKLVFSQLLLRTQLNPMDLSMAIGWLAREDKVIFTEEEGKEYISVFRECYY